MALLHVDFFSDVLGMCAEMDVILPERTRGQIGMEGKRGEGKYPVLYLLHGMSDDHTIWQRRTSIERYAADYGIAVVMPSTQLGWYTDMQIGLPWFTYITQELPAICRSFFPNMSEKREDTFVAGLSMGGYGALKCALRAPETYCAAASLSGAVDVSALTLEKPVKQVLLSNMETEAKAGAIVKEADAKCRKILDDASKEADMLKADQAEEIRRQAESMMEAAKEQGAQSLKEAASAVEKEISALKELASEKEEQAVSLVISQLVS